MKVLPLKERSKVRTLRYETKANRLKSIINVVTYKEQT